ncbi:putative Cytochrome P450 monooxygenase [Aspergillus lentulus]|nr:putative Cytochrome P450 monooxygenase [Aspergillus lentulus]
MLLVHLAAGVVAGISTHLGIFIRGEWERRTPIVARVYLVLVVFIELLRYLGHGTSFPITYLYISYCGGLFGSIFVYRIWLHPLRDFPGPFMAKATGFWSLWKNLPHYGFYKDVRSLHEQYGDFVRIRPREISICNIDALQSIHSYRSPCIKGPFYDILPGRSLQSTRDKASHAKRRRVWDMGFTARGNIALSITHLKALRAYEPQIKKHCLSLVGQLSKRTEAAVEITQWFHFFSFDVMGDLVFGAPFHMIENGKPHFIRRKFEVMITTVSSLVCVPWLFILLQQVPVVAYLRAKWVAWCALQIDERKKVRYLRKDLFSYLLGEGVSQQRLPRLSDIDMVLDSELAIGAGSETVSFTLSAVIYLLARNPEKAMLLYAEINSILPSPNDLSHEKISHAPYLNGCINEALRLYPAVLNGVQRIVPAGGAMIANRWIPGDTFVSTPTYSIHRGKPHSRYFIQPDEFIPERWTSRPELIISKNAFNPFLSGSYSCVGKDLALMEIRMLIAVFVSSFSFRLANREMVIECFEKIPGVQDKITAHGPSYELILSERKKV